MITFLIPLKLSFNDSFFIFSRRLATKPINNKKDSRPRRVADKSPPSDSFDRRKPEGNSYPSRRSRKPYVERELTSKEIKSRASKVNSTLDRNFGMGPRKNRDFYSSKNRFGRHKNFNKKNFLPSDFYDNLPPSVKVHHSKFSKFAYIMGRYSLQKDKISRFLKWRQLLRGRLRALIPLSFSNWKVPPRRYWRARFRWPFEKVRVPELRVVKSRRFILSFRRPYTSKSVKKFILREPASAVPYVLSEIRSPFKSYAKYKSKVKRSIIFHRRRKKFGWPKRKRIRRKWWWKRPETFDIFGYSSRRGKRSLPKLRFIQPTVLRNRERILKFKPGSFSKSVFPSRDDLQSPLLKSAYSSTKLLGRRPRRFSWIPGMWGPSVLKFRRYRRISNRLKRLSGTFVRSRTFRSFKKSKKIRLLKALFLSFYALDRRSLIRRLPRYRGERGLYRSVPSFRSKLSYPGIARFSKRSFFHISGAHVRSWERYADSRRRRVGRFVIFYYGPKEFMHFAVHAKKQINFMSFRRTANNFFITVFKRSGQLILSRSAGTLKLKGPRRSTVEAASDLMAKVIGELKEKKIRSINVLLRTKRTSRHVRAVLKTFKKIYPTGIGPLFLRLPARSHNGLRSKKRTRG